MRRELRVVATEKVVGYVDVGTSGTVVFGDAAEDVFRGLRTRADDDTAFANQLMADGWSNGYLYLAEATP